MAVIANIVINDGLAVATTFTPNGRLPGSEAVRYRNSAASVAQSRTIITDVRSKASVDRVTGKVTIPVFDAPVDGSQPSQQYALVGSFDFSVPTAATAAQRKDIRVFLSNLLLNTQVIAMVDSGEHQFS